MVERIVSDKEYYKARGSDNVLDQSAARFNPSLNNQAVEHEIHEERNSPSKASALEGPKAQATSVKTVNTGGRQVRILTINMFMRPVVNTNGTDHKEGRLKAFADKYLNQYDIICFQELFDWLSTRKQRMILEAKKAGMPYHAFSPAPKYFSTYCCDAGLLTVSKYPVTNSQFTNYKFPPVGDDAISMKGVLYTEIDLSELGGDKLHLFHSHFQASYYGKGIPLYVETFVARYEQVKEMQRFVRKHTIENPHYNKDSDLVILAGDFNQNAAPMNRLQKEYYDLIKVQERYRPIMQMFHDEYRSMMNALQHQPLNPQGWTLIDCLRHSQGEGRFNPVTFADVYIDENGHERPIEPELIGDEDSCSKQALDYIFWLVPNACEDLPAILNQVPNNSIPIANHHQTSAAAASSAQQYATQQQQNLARMRNRARVAVEKTKLEKLPVEGYVFSFCSDHYGISSVIEL